MAAFLSLILGAIFLGGGLAYLTFPPHDMTRERADGTGIALIFLAIVFFVIGKVAA